MPWKSYIDLSVNCVFVEHMGEFENVEPIVQLEALLENSDFSPGLNVLRDLRNAIVPEYVNFDFLRSLMPRVESLDRQYPKHPKICATIL